MPRIAPLLASTLMTLVVGAGALAASPAAQDSDAQVVGQALTGLEIPGKISAVMWTRRETHFTLQISRRTAAERGNFRIPAQAPPAAAGPDQDKVQVWLLRADGTHIAPLHGPGLLPSVSDMERCIRCLGYWASFSFPLSAGGEAVAVAMQFNDQFRIERLPALPGNPAALAAAPTR
jgi:hypothetical protein